MMNSSPDWNELVKHFSNGGLNMGDFHIEMDANGNMNINHNSKYNHIGSVDEDDDIEGNCCMCDKPLLYGEVVYVEDMGIDSQLLELGEEHSEKVFCKDCSEEIIQVMGDAFRKATMSVKDKLDALGL